MGLDLYSKVEELFFSKEVFILWSKFIEILKKYEIKEILDIGCGNGDFCKLAKENGIKVKGIDLSENQVKKAKKKGCDCIKKEICSLNDKFDSAVAIFDVINYLDKHELEKFFKCVRKLINRYFIFDINTLYSMEDLAVGTLKAESENRFSVLFSKFEDNKLITEITLFEKKANCYIKHQKYITQYYHSLKEIIDISKMQLIETIPISLYGSEEAEKLIIVLKNENISI